jgi:hypothetical protein
MYPKTFLFYRLLSQIGSVTLWSVLDSINYKSAVRLSRHFFIKIFCTMTVLPYKEQEASKKEQVAQMFNNISHKYDF